MTVPIGDGPGNWDEFEATANTALELARLHGTSKAIGFIASTALTVPENERSEFTEVALYRTAKDYAWDLETTSEDLTTMFDAIPPSWGLANRVAAIGKAMSQDNYFRSRSRDILRYASNIFNGLCDAKFESLALDVRIEYLTQDYLRVAALQDEAENRPGATETALLVAPRLLRLADEAKQTDADGQLEIDYALGDAALYIGDADPIMMERLLRAVTDEDQRIQVAEMLIRDKIGAMLQAGDVAEAISVMKISTIQPSLETWQAAYALQNMAQNEAALTVIDAVAEAFPSYYADCSDTEVYMGPIVRVLERAGRDDLLSVVFNGQLQSEASLLPLERFAYTCGTHNDVRRLQAVMNSCTLASGQAAAIFKAFETGSTAHLKL